MCGCPTTSSVMALRPNSPQLGTVTGPNQTSKSRSRLAHRESCLVTDERRVFRALDASTHRRVIAPHPPRRNASAASRRSRLGMSALLFLQGLGDLTKTQKVHDRQDQESKKDQCRFGHINLLPSKCLVANGSGETYKSAAFRPSILSTGSTAKERTRSGRTGGSSPRGACRVFFASLFFFLRVAAQLPL